MKSIKALLGAVLLLTGCSKEFLELAPTSSPNVTKFYDNPDDILNGVNAAYSTLQSGNLYGGRDLQDLTEYRADNIFDDDPSGSSGIRFNIDQFIAGATNEIVEDVWQSLYQAIYRCNIVLENADNVEGDAATLNRYRAEVRFIRALCYFHAVRLWGDVPLVLQVESPEASRENIRNRVGEVYTAIEEDLRFAIANLPATYPESDLGRATSGAAQGLLGKVFLTQQKYAQAVTVLTQLTESGQFDLMPSIASVFDPANEYNQEILFAVVFTVDNTEEDHGHFFSLLGDTVEPSLRALFPDDDERSEMLALINPEGTASEVPTKFFEPLSGAGTVGTDFPVLRYADVLLLLAEALNEQGYVSGGAAFDAINAVRNRAGLAAYTATDLSGQEIFRDAVLLERRLELPLELHRWYDLLRTGRAKEAMAEVGFSINDNQLLYPIPNSQVLIYNDPEGFPQNPGY